jgi:endonuclease YncB( thermonuclease family)
LTGKIVRVINGDMAVLLDATNTERKIRLSGIDAPEERDIYGYFESWDQLSWKINGKLVTVETKGHYMGYTLGIIYLGDTNVNSKMIEDGYAWISNNSYLAGSWIGPHERSLQERAERLEHGLWRVINAVKSEQRHKNKEKVKKKAEAEKVKKRAEANIAAAEKAEAEKARIKREFERFRRSWFDFDSIN